MEKFEIFYSKFQIQFLNTTIRWNIFWGYFWSKNQNQLPQHNIRNCFRDLNILELSLWIMKIFRRKMACESKTGRQIRYFVGRQRNESDEAGFYSGACSELLGALLIVTASTLGFQSTSLKTFLSEVLNSMINDMIASKLSVTGIFSFYKLHHWIHLSFIFRYGVIWIHFRLYEQYRWWLCK